MFLLVRFLFPEPENVLGAAWAGVGLAGPVPSVQDMAVSLFKHLHAFVTSSQSGCTKAGRVEKMAVSVGGGPSSVPPDSCPHRG